MGTEINDHGLKRTIPEDIKRQIRQECGFGCVCCGLAIATYEHIDPPFKDATCHDPSKMAYLCGSCHDKVTRGQWSKEKIKVARANPWCLSKERCHDSFDISSSTPTIWVGPNEIINMHKIFMVDNEVILSINPPSQPGLPFTISGVFYDDKGNLLFRIIENEWEGEIENWDIEVIGPRVIIRTSPRKIALCLRALPPDGILIEKADMFYQHARLVVNEYQASLTTCKKGEVVLQGRRIIGLTPGTTFIAAYSSGNWKLGGGDGDFRIEGVPANIPDVIKNRSPIGKNSKCPCGSGGKYKHCCLKKPKNGKVPGRGASLTFEGLPLAEKINAYQIIAR